MNLYLSLSKKISLLYSFIIRSAGEIRYAKDHTCNNRRFLKPGRYHMINYGKMIIYRNDKASKEFMKKYIAHIERKGIRYKNIFKSFLLTIIKYFSGVRSYVIDHGCDLNDTGTIMIISSNGDHKIFDIDNRKVISRIVDPDRFAGIKYNIKVFANHFDMPRIIFDDMEKTIEEDYINFIPFLEWSDVLKNDLIRYLFNSYIKYFNSIDHDKIRFVSFDFILARFQEQDHPDWVTKKIMALVRAGDLSEELPVVTCHGDLNFRNILPFKDKYYLIDWEFSGENIFFYDIMNFIFWEAINNDFEHLFSYLSGAYDEYFHKAFSSFHMAYDIKKRPFYIGVFIIKRMLDFGRVVDKGPMTIILNEYIKAADKVLAFIGK